jgi:hypothetical protein
MFTPVSRIILLVGLIKGQAQNFDIQKHRAMQKELP